MTNFYILSNIDSDSSDSDSENSDYEQDEDMQMTSAEKPKQATCLKPLSFLKIKEMEPIINEDTLSFT